MDTVMQPDMAAGDDVDQALVAAKRLISAGRAAGAEHLVPPLAAAAPGRVETQYVLAVAQRFAGRNAAALKTLQAVLARAPEYGRAYQDMAYNFRDMGRSQEAAAAFERAVTLDPSLVASWRALEQMHAASGDEQRGAMAAAQRRWFEDLPSALQTVAGLIGERRLQSAEERCRAYLRDNPVDVEGMRLLAQIGVRLHVYDDAEYLLESAVTFAPDNTAA